LATVWNAASEVVWPYGPAVQLLILTGARRAEIAEMKWSEINGNAIKLSGSRAKNAEAHDIPLSEQALEVLLKIPRVVGSEFVFGKPLKGGAWSNAKIKLSATTIQPWRIHDLRRTVSTGMNELGTEPHIVEAVLGHTVKGVAGVYNRAKYAAAKRAALEAWGAHVSTLVGASS